MRDLHRIDPTSIPLLQEIPKPPTQLYVRGTLPSLELKWLAVVGSRALTSYGKQACEFLLKGLRGYPIAIVSGLAYGADACAHAVALDIGLPTIAVPGSGLNYDILYPRAHVPLARRIIASGGAHLSEFEPDLKATDYSFPQRNRIMAGMSHATLVIEAKERSGSLITARLATDYNRELLVVPGPIFSDMSKGTHQFLKLGATPVTEPGDILKALGIDSGPAAFQMPADLSAVERKILELLEQPVSKDRLLEALKINISEAHIILSTLELKGFIVESVGLVRRS